MAVNITTRTLIQRAFGIADSQLSGEPDWVNSEFYDINAKMDDQDAAAIEKMPAEQQTQAYRFAFQSLLAERFRLKVTHEKKELPIFALVVAKGGIKFSPTKLPPEGADSADDKNRTTRGTSVSGNGREYTASGNGVKMTAWATSLSNQPELDGRLAVDETGLTGEYDLAIRWTRQRLSDTREASVDPRATLDPSGPSLFTALLEQLGLKLEPKKGPVDTIVIVHIERPSEN